METNGEARQIRQARHEVLVALKMMYPASLRGDQVLRMLLAMFPQLKWNRVKKDLAHLCQKGYVQRIIAQDEDIIWATPWRKRWFRLTSHGAEAAK